MDKDKKEKKQPTEADRERAGVYKGYSINWLKKLGEEHPKFYLVAEFEAKQKKENK